jgi:hypothetical protein
MDAYTYTQKLAQQIKEADALAQKRKAALIKKSGMYAYVKDILKCTVGMRGKPPPAYTLPCMFSCFLAIFLHIFDLWSNISQVI